MATSAGTSFGTDARYGFFLQETFRYVSQNELKTRVMNVKIDIKNTSDEEAIYVYSRKNKPVFLPKKYFVCKKTGMILRE